MIVGETRHTKMANHAHWITYGFSSKCSNCGNSRIGSTNYCMRCGYLMDEPEEFDVPKFTTDIKLPQRIICPFCNQDMFEIKSQVKFCYNCGMRIDDE